MHELALAGAILRGTRTELEQRGGGRLSGVTVRIGELEAVEPALLQFAWQALTADGPHAGARLQIEVVRAGQACAVCGEVAELQPGSWLRLCPRCERPLNVTGGRALELLELRFEPAPVPVCPSEVSP